MADIDQQEQAPAQASTDIERTEKVSNPAKVLRIGAMARRLLEELRDTELDEGSREQLKDAYQMAQDQLRELLSSDLEREFDELTLGVGDGTPSGPQLRVAHAQLVGWLDGLFQGLQASVLAEQMSRQQMGAGAADGARDDSASAYL